MRNIVITGAGSGIGAMCVELVTQHGDTPIGLDLKNAEFEVDLSDSAALEATVAKVREAYGHVDGIIANAGTQTNSTLDLKVNYYGARDTIRAFRPLLTGSENARIAITASAASLQPTDPQLVELLLDGDRDAALAYGQALADQGGMIGYLNYSASKRAIATWVRRVAPTAEFAGAGIGINAVAPGVVATPMTTELLSTEEGRQLAHGAMPAPYNGTLRPEDIADVLVFLVSGLNRSMTGQIIYVDGGFDSLHRGEDLWHAPKSMDAPAADPQP